MDKSAKNILAYIEKLGYKPTDISHILLTHSHIDHIRPLKKLKDLSNAKIAVHGSEANIISGKKPQIFSKSFLGFFYKISMIFIKYNGVKPDIIFKNNSKLFGLRVIHTPGHTPGSVCFFDNKTKVLFCGDMLFYDKGSESFLSKPNVNINNDILKFSLLKISKLSSTYILPGHDDIIGPDASKRLRSFLKKL